FAQRLDLEAVPLEERLHEIADVTVVIDDEHSCGGESARGGRRTCGLCFGLHIFVCIRQVAAGEKGRGERIRTSDLTVPNRARYQTALRPEKSAEASTRPRTCQRNRRAKSRF